MELAQRKRGDFVTMDYIDENRVNVIYQIPLAEIVFDSVSYTHLDVYKSQLLGRLFFLIPDLACS